MQRRPSGVTLSAVVLGVFDLFLLVGGLLYAIIAILFARNPGMAFSSAHNPAPPLHLMVTVLAIFAVMTLACAAWGISTFAGLLRMRNWARISIMIIGGCLTAFSLLSLFGNIMAQYTMQNFVPPPNSGSANLVATDPHVLRGMFFFLDGVYAVVAVIGVWWLVYFALRRTRNAFELAPPQTPLSNTAQLNPATPITDFSVAQTIDPAQTAETNAELHIADVQPVAASNDRPISMTIIAALMFLGALVLLPLCMLSMPLFFFGIEFHGWSAHTLLIALAVLEGAAGFGLLKRMHLGWLLSVGLYILGLLNMLTLLSPPIRDRWIAVSREAANSMMPMTPNSASISAQMMQQSTMTVFLVPALVISTALMVFLLVLLWRARWWYKTAA